MNLLQLADRLEQRARNVPKLGAKKAANVALAIVRDLVEVTPVDVTTALSNWQVRIGSRVSQPINAYSPGESGSTRDLSIVYAMLAARGQLENKTPGRSIYISNVLSYIARLNEGYSAQEPAGFVERALLVGRLEARK